MKKIISVMLVLTTLISVGSMCSANSISQEMDLAPVVGLSKDENCVSVCSLSDEELQGESAVVGDLAIVTESGSLENNRAGLFTELFAAVMCVGWLICDVIIPLGTLVLVGGVLIYAAVADSKGK